MKPGSQRLPDDSVAAGPAVGKLDAGDRSSFPPSRPASDQHQDNTTPHRVSRSTICCNPRVMSTNGSTRDARRRKFKVQSEFGNARQWRSRKNRPCDVCRKRKTVCVITSEPPCKPYQFLILCCPRTARLIGYRSFLQGARPGMHVNRSLETVLVHSSGNTMRRLPTGRGTATGPWPPVDTDDCCYGTRSLPS